MRNIYINYKILRTVRGGKYPRPHFLCSDWQVIFLLQPYVSRSGYAVGSRILSPRHCTYEFRSYLARVGLYSRNLLKIRIRGGCLDYCTNLALVISLVVWFQPGAPCMCTKFGQKPLRMVGTHQLTPVS